MLSFLTKLFFSTALFLFVLSSIFSQESQNSQSSNTAHTILPFTPSHESSIKMLATHNSFLYSLDKNGLLNISNTKTLSPVNYTIITRKGKIISAKFQYPYIAFTDDTNALRVYNVKYNFEVFALSQYDPLDNSYEFSPSGKFFIYTYDKKIHILSSESWQEKYTHTYLGSLRFITVSKTENTYLIYDTDGNISYKNIDSGNVIKTENTNTSLSFLHTNISRRFAAGIDGSKLMVIDLVNGETVESLLFPNELQAIYVQKNSNTIMVLSDAYQQSNNTQSIRFFNFQNDGTLIEHDIDRITELKNISMLHAQQGELYLGYDNGQVLFYDFFDKQFLPILLDKTIANYDSIISDNTILFANVDGIRSASLTDVQLKNNTATRDIKLSFSPQTFTKPQFIQGFSDVQTVANSNSSLGVLSQLDKNALFFLLSLENTPTQMPIPIRVPTKLTFLPSITLASRNIFFTYSENLSTFILHQIQKNDDLQNTNISPDTTNNVSIKKTFTYKIDEIPQVPIFDLTSYNEPTVLTNAVLQTNKTKQNYNVLYSYTFQKSENTDNLKIITTNTLNLPFETNTIAYIKQVNTHTYLIVRTITSSLSKEFECIIVQTTQEQKNATKENQKITQLSRIPYSDNAHFLFKQNTQVQADNTISLIISDDYGINLLNILIKKTALDIEQDTEKLSQQTTVTLVSKTFTPYPHKFASIINIHNTNDYITAVDINNLALVAQIVKSHVLMKAIMIIKDKEDRVGTLITHNL